MHTRQIGKLSLLCGVLIVLMAILRTAQADEVDQVRGLMAKQSSAIVTVKAVLKMQITGGNGQETEYRTEMQGVVVSPDGLVMLSSMPFSTKSIASMFGGDTGDAGLGMKINPTDFKVVIEKEDKEYSAFMVATDTTLTLAFIKLEDLGDRKLTAVDFSGTTTPDVGQKLIGIARLSKGFDYAPYYKAAQVSGEIGKPRKAYILDGSIASLGLPVYSLSGDVLGALTTLAPGTKEEGGIADGMGFGFLMRMMGGGGGSLLPAFVVPNSAVNAVIAQAKTRAVTVAAERAKTKTTQPAGSAKSDGAAKTTGNPKKP
jgi:hypothetical protein